MGSNHQNRTIVAIFFLAFLLNFILENLHSNLYLHYQDSPITELVLLRATLFDAVFITLLSLLFLKFQYFRKRLWHALIIGLIAAIAIELYALETGRWAYSDWMPIIPLLNTGLTPTIQLGVLAYIILKIITRGRRDLNPQSSP